MTNVISLHAPIPAAVFLVAALVESPVRSYFAEDLLVDCRDYLEKVGRENRHLAGMTPGSIAYCIVRQETRSQSVNVKVSYGVL